MKTLVESGSANLPQGLKIPSIQLRRLYPNLSLSPSARNIIEPSTHLCATSCLSNLAISTENQYYIQNGDFKRQCRIKFQTKSSNLELFQRIKAELKTLKQIIEQNGSFSGNQFIQSLLAGFHNDLHAFMVVDYYATSLADLSSNSLTEFQSASSAVILAAEFVLALNFLHSRGVLHQDLKPANVMISPDGHIVIGSFGSSLLQNTSGIIQVKRHREDVVTFTPRYAAPEINFPDGKGNLVYDERVDWWGLGVILYELATDERPFSPPPTIQKKVADLPMTPAFIHLQELAVMEGTIDPQLISFICSLLQSDPSHRLSGSAVKAHTFFEIIADIWEDVAALRHPPFAYALASLQEGNMPAAYECKDSPSLPTHDTTKTLRYKCPLSWSSSLEESPTSYTSIYQSRSNKPLLDHTNTDMNTLDWPRRRRHTIAGSNTPRPILERCCLPTSRSMPVGRLSLEESLTVALLKAMDSRDSMNHRAQQAKEDRNTSFARKVWQIISRV